MENLDANYWQNRYKNGEIGWDIGFPSTPLRNFIEKIDDKEIKILIPGGGNAYELEYLYLNGFKNSYLLDWAEGAINNLKKRLPAFPEAQLFCENFFDHNKKYDLILEQTFFCALNPELREKYVEKMHQLLKPNGQLVGLLFNRVFEKQGPPFGGTKTAYEKLFSPYFEIEILEDCYNSIPPRAGSELFFKFLKKNEAI